MGMGESQITIRAAEKARDADAIWGLAEPVFRAGQTYPVAPDVPRKEGLAYWFTPEKSVYVAEKDDTILGVYYLKANNQGPGAHICNCGYITGEAAQGQGIASLMCRHSLKQARIKGFRAMQFNLVVSTNHKAVRLWRRLGFEIVGTLPGVFHIPEQGDVDAYVMYQKL